MTSNTLPPTISGLRKIIADRAVSVKEAVDAQFAHLHTYASRYRCVTYTHSRPTKISADNILSGVGLAHKDIFDTAARHAGCGRLQQQGGSPRKGSATSIKRLDETGAVNLAALTMAEYACGATGQSYPTLQPINPLDADLAVGGSSSGSAVAVAAGLCYASLGTDTAGSVRIPAATCGILGLKTTHGVIPSDGVFPLAPSLDTVGVIARSSVDAAHIIAALGHHCHRELRFAAETYEGLEQQMLSQTVPHVAVVLESDALSDDVALAFEEFARSIQSLTKVSSVSIPEMQEMNRCAETVLHVEAAHVHWSRLRAQKENLQPGTRAITEPGTMIPALWYREALTRRAAYIEAVIAQCFKSAEILIVPAIPVPLPDWSVVHTESSTFNPRQLFAMHAWMPFVNYLGFPSVVFPVGRDSRNRPVSVQAIGRPYSECALLSFAYHIERERHGLNGFVMPIEPVRLQH